MAQRNAAKMSNNLPQLQALQLKMTEARQTGNQLEGKFCLCIVSVGLGMNWTVCIENIQQILLHHGFVRHGFDCTQSANHIVIEYEMKNTTAV
jgi:hypothetical protein